MGMFFPDNVDRFGKFFFFEIEDIYNFVYNYTNATPNDVILELDIDRETALKYLSVADISQKNKWKIWVTWVTAYIPTIMQFQSS